MQRDDEEAAKVYEEFVKDFGGGDDEPGKKVFVRGGVIQPGQSGSATAAHGSASADKPALGGKRHYVPSFVPPPMADASAEKKDDAEEARGFRINMRI